MVIALPVAFLFAGLAYLALARSWSLASAAAALFLCRMGGSTLWVFSTVLLQQTADDQYMGRIFAAEGALCTLMMALSGYATGWALDSGVTAFTTTAIMGAIALSAGAAWGIGLARNGWQAPKSRAETPDEQISAGRDQKPAP